MKNKNTLLNLDRIHPYPAKYTVSMIEDLILKYTEKGDLILDPFCGAGTTLLAARYLMRRSVGFDINPVGYLISSIKSTDYSKYAIEDITVPSIQELSNLVGFNELYYDSIEHWFRKNAIIGLSAIRSWIDVFNDDKIKNIYKIAFSQIINEVSNQESDTRYASVDKGDITIEQVFLKFIEKTKQVQEVLIDIGELSTESKVFLADSRKVSNYIENNSVDFIITSPPYPNTYDYYLYHKHRMIWLGYNYKDVMNTEIGSRREFSSLKKESSKFTEDLRIIFSECMKSLKQDGHICVIIGDGRIAGEKYDSKDEFIKMSKELGLSVVEYYYVDLDNTSKTFTKSFRTKEKKEHFIILKRG